MQWKDRWFDDWSEGFDFAQKHAITGLVFAEIERLSPQIPGMPEMLLFQWIGTTEQIKQQNHIVNHEVEALAKLLDGNGIRYAIVKGQVVASYYTQNDNDNLNHDLGLLRQSGDIDFYVPDEEIERAKEVICKEWEVVMERGNSEKHYHFEHGGVTFEMHFQLFQWYQENKEKYWQEILHKAMGYKVLIGDTPVATLEPTVHTLYVFIHLYHHLVEVGVGLRQFCDLASMLQSGSMDIELLKKHLKALGMTRAFRACEYILNEKLDLPKEYLPYKIRGIDQWFGRRILDLVLYRGNMGHYNKRNGWHGLGHKVESACIKFSHFVKFWWLSPRYSWNGILSEIKNKT